MSERMVMREDANLIASAVISANAMAFEQIFEKANEDEKARLASYSL